MWLYRPMEDLRNDDPNEGIIDKECWDFVTSSRLNDCIARKQGKSNSDELLKWNHISQIHKDNPQIFLSLCQHIGKGTAIPDDINIRTTSFIAKPGKKSHYPGKKRALTQSNHILSMVSSCAKSAATDLVTPLWPPTQCGGRKHRMPEDQVISILWLAEYAWYHMMAFYIKSTDLSKAFDFVYRPCLITRWRHVYNLGGELLQFFAESLKNNFTMIKNNKMYTGLIKTRISTGQGWEPSMLAFNCYFSKVSDDISKSGVEGIVLSDFNRREEMIFEHEYMIKKDEEDIISMILNELSFCDDMYLLANTITDLLRINGCYSTSCVNIGMQANGSKCGLGVCNTKYMTKEDKAFISKYYGYNDTTYNEDTSTDHGLFIAGKRVQRVYEMRILGVNVSFNRYGHIKFTPHVKIKTEKATNQCKALIHNGLNHSNSNMMMRSRIYTIVLESNITYGSRSIYYSKPNLKSIQQSQNNILRLLYELPRNTSPQIIRIALGIILIIAKI
eukprot:9309_1